MWKTNSFWKLCKQCEENKILKAEIEKMKKESNEKIEDFKKIVLDLLKYKYPEDIIIENPIIIDE